MSLKFYLRDCAATLIGKLPLSTGTLKFLCRTSGRRDGNSFTIKLCHYTVEVIKIQTRDSGYPLFIYNE